MSESCPKIGDVPKSPFHTAAGSDAIGRRKDTPNKVAFARRTGLADDRRTPERATMTVPHYIGENESDTRGIRCGWYAIEDGGDLSSGPFSNRAKCVRRITQPTDVTGWPDCNVY